MEILFTATEDLSAETNSPTFQATLADFLKKTLGPSIIRTSVTYDAPVDAEPGDPHDLV